jgi:hypothetical protein
MTDYGFLINTILLAGVLFVLFRFHKLVNNNERAVVSANHDAKLRFLVYVSRKLMADLYTSLDLATLTACPKMYVRADGTIENVQVILKRFHQEYNQIIDRLSVGLQVDYMKINKIVVNESADGKEVSITVHWSNKYTDVLVFSHNHLQQAIYQLDRLTHRLSTFGYTAPHKDMYQL